MKFIQILLNLIPNFKGKLRLAKLVVRNKNHERYFTTKNGLNYFVPNLIENVSFELFVNGVYEKDTIDLICKSIPKNGIFIDVGANIGAIALTVAKFRPDVEIHAFEASTKIFKFLEINKKTNHLNNLNIYNFAIHEEHNKNLLFYSPDLLNGKGSFAPVFTDSAEEVISKNLDVFFEEKKLKPNFVKIDVEGFELTVFKSMKDFIHKSCNCIFLFEFVDWAEKLSGFEVGESQSFFLDKGYKLFKMSGEQIQQPLVSGNYMIVANKEPKKL
jgi:FkbM family methyltransferase